MFKALFDYFPVGPVLVALLIFILLPFDESNALTANHSEHVSFSAVVGFE
jgi:hypothetical protein